MHCTTSPALPPDWSAKHRTGKPPRQKTLSRILRGSSSLLAAQLSTYAQRVNHARDRNRSSSRSLLTAAPAAAADTMLIAHTRFAATLSPRGRRKPLRDQR